MSFAFRSAVSSSAGSILAFLSKGLSRSGCCQQILRKRRRAHQASEHLKAAKYSWTSHMVPQTCPCPYLFARVIQSSCSGEVADGAKCICSSRRGGANYRIHIYTNRTCCLITYRWGKEATCKPTSSSLEVRRKAYHRRFGDAETKDM
jgi:hypothetical protein